MKVIYTLEDFRKVFTPFENGCHYIAVFKEDGGLGVKLGCWGVMILLCQGLEKELLSLFSYKDDGIYNIQDILTQGTNREVIFDFNIQELKRLLMEIPPCKICGGTLFSLEKNPNTTLTRGR